MRLLVRALIALLVLGAAYGALNYLASERVEVVTLHTVDPAGLPTDTRIWIVDRDGAAFIRAREGSGWYARVRAAPNLELTRGERRARYTAVARPELRDDLNRLFRTKYGWGDAFISFTLGGRSDAVALELVPLRPSSLAP